MEKCQTKSTLDCQRFDDWLGVWHTYSQFTKLIVSVSNIEPKMSSIDYRCRVCGHRIMSLVFKDEKPCYEETCCKCCKKQGLQSPECKMAMLEFDRFANGVQLSSNDIKGLLLEKAVHDALRILKIPHNHNPLNNTYPCYQNKAPDVIIKDLDTIIECKNLNKKQVDHLTEKWLDKHIIKRDYASGYGRKLALFSYKPRSSLIKHLNKHCWKVYSLEQQILTYRQEQKAIGNLIRTFYWLNKEYYGGKPAKPKEQTRLRLNYQEVIR
jgi:hypothetical protein